jgi:hypothetical protein
MHVRFRQITFQILKCGSGANVINKKLKIMMCTNARTSRRFYKNIAEPFSDVLLSILFITINESVLRLCSVIFLYNNYSNNKNSLLIYVLNSTTRDQLPSQHEYITTQKQKMRTK